MKKNFFFIATAAAITASLLAGCAAQTGSGQTSASAKVPETTSETQKPQAAAESAVSLESKNTESSEMQASKPDTPNIISDLSMLAAQPAYGANPDYDIWTTVPYLVEDAQIQFTATISADKELKNFEMQCFFFEDQKAQLEASGGTFTVTVDELGFMKDIAPKVVQYAVEQNLWLSTKDCPGQYGVFNDPGDQPVAVNYIPDNRPLYVQAGVWEDDFERGNQSLNGLATEIKDETLAAYKQPCDTKGTVEAFQYDTYYYAKDLEDGDALSHATPITKTAYAYLPAGYDPTKEYNILYLLHGGGDNAAKWFSQQDTGNGEIGSGYAVNILDHLIADKKAEPFIVITPGLYNEEDEGTQELNGYTETFAYELRDLMPVAESKYSTYAADTSDEGLIASRDHRAFAGLSMGSLTTWHSAVAQCLDVVGWFGNMSGGPSSDVGEAKDYTTNTLIPAIEKAYADSYPIHMLLSMNGVHDIALEPHVETHKLLVDFADNNDALTVGENYDFIVSDGAHNFEAWNLYLYDMAQVFFK